MNSEKKINVNDEKVKEFFGDGFFKWQYGKKDHYQKMYEQTPFSEERWWGTFPKDDFDPETNTLPSWAIGPFVKYEGNPIFVPSKAGWDSGRFGGGVHNGATVRKDGKFYYIYRGEQTIPASFWDDVEPHLRDVDFICDIGVAVSDDGIHFARAEAYNPLFRRGEDAKYSYEDVCVVKHGDTYYLYCNQWDWKDRLNTKTNGVFIAASKDLLHWEKKGIAFPKAAEIHRNPCVLQNPENEAVKVNGKFVMYLNHGIVAYSDDLLHWESKKLSEFWPGGEGCFAVTEYDEENPDHIVLFTGGHHTGHFYAIGEVLLSKDNPEEAIEWLPRPIIFAEDKYPWEDCCSVEDPSKIISCFRDCIFFTGMTRYDNKWWMYYGGSEVYTCLATAEAKK
jgi:predicted GH43/DUF377 family glycosyl hydrolase